MTSRAVLGLVVLGLAACGADQTQLSSQELDRRLDEVCAGANEDVDALSVPDKGEPPLKTAFLLPWEDGISVIIYMRPDVTDEQTTALRDQLKSDGDLQLRTYLDQRAAKLEFDEVFADAEEMLSSVQSEDLPASFRLEVARADQDAVTARYSDVQGVKDVVLYDETLGRYVRDLRGYAAAAARIRDEEASELDALRPPEAQEATTEELVDELRTEEDLLERLDDALAARRQAAVTTVARRADEHMESLAAAARQAGSAACAESAFDRLFAAPRR